MGPNLAQGRWTPEESRLAISVLELWVIRLCLEWWTEFFGEHLVRIQSVHATAVACVKHQGRTKSAAAALKASCIL